MSVFAVQPIRGDLTKRHEAISSVLNRLARIARGPHRARLRELGRFLRSNNQSYRSLHIQLRWLPFSGLGHAHYLPC